MIGEAPFGVLPLGALDPASEAATSAPYAGIFDDPDTALEFLIEIEYRPEQA